MPPLTPYTLQNGKSTTLSANILAAASTASLSAPSIADFTQDYLIIDYDVPAKYEIVLCNVTGTSVTSMSRGQLGTSAVDHGSGAKVAYGMVSKHYDDLTTGLGFAAKLKGGWFPVGVNGTYVNSTTFTLAGDWTGIIRKYARLNLTNVSEKWFIVTAISHSTGTTTVTAKAGTSYTLASGSITGIFFSHLEAPVGFPDTFSWVPDASVNISGTASTNVWQFSCSAGGVVYLWGTYAGGVTCTNGANSSAITIPIAASRSGPVGQFVAGLGGIVNLAIRYYSLANSTAALSSTANYMHIRAETGAGPATGNALEFYGGWSYQAE